MHVYVSVFCNFVCVVELDTFHSDAFVFIFHLFEFSYILVFSFSLTLSDTTANAQLCSFYFSFVCLLIQLFSENAPWILPNFYYYYYLYSLHDCYIDIIKLAPMPY